MKRSSRRSTLRRWQAGVGLALLLPVLASAQTIYRFVGPSGGVTFADKPPAADARGSMVVPAAGPAGTAAADATGNLPYELRQLALRYPVTLLTTDNCTPCNHARALLQTRGIPFREHTVTTPQDGEALKNLSNDTALPLLIIGTQQLKGFSDAEWHQFLTAAGYPQQSQLPAGYRQPPAMPLVNLQKPAATPRPPENRPPPPPPAGDGAANPAGIVF